MNNRTKLIAAVPDRGHRLVAGGYVSDRSGTVGSAGHGYYTPPPPGSR